MRTLLLMMRLLRLVSRRLEFCRATLTVEVMTVGLPETRFKRRCSVETVSVSSKYRTISNGASSWHRPAIGRRASRGETPAKDLFFDIETNLFGEEEVYTGTRRRGLRSRFPPLQARADAHTKAVDNIIRDIHLQRGLKDHPSTQAQKGELCCLSSFVI